MRYWSYIFAIVKKDILIELRAKETVIAMLVFGLLVIVVFSFAFALGVEEQKGIAPGLLWVAFTFAGILGLNHTFSTEYENGMLQGLLLMPIPRSVIYVGKLISNIIFMLASELIIFGIFLWFFDVRFTGNWFNFFLIILFGTIGFAATGTLFSAVSSGLRMKTFLLPILQFPVAVPVIIAAIEGTACLLDDTLFVGFFDWFNMLLVFNVIFITASVLLFEYILEE